MAYVPLPISHPDNPRHERWHRICNRWLAVTLTILWPMTLSQATDWNGYEIAFMSFAIPFIGFIGIVLLLFLFFEVVPGTWRWLKVF